MAKIIPADNGSRKDVITQKATILFRRKGFPATSMREIAEAIGVEAPSLYNHISSKSDILKDICLRVARLYVGNLKNVELKRDSCLIKIETIIRFHIKMLIEEHEIVYIADHEWRHLPEPIISDFKAQRRNYRSRLASIIEEGISKGEIRDVHPMITVHTILSAINGVENWQRSGKKIDPGLMEENMVLILLQGLKYRS
jgi:TetR/AcrR family transcriptional regulator, cholesterol catabolism regulator